MLDEGKLEAGSRGGAWLLEAVIGRCLCGRSLGQRKGPGRCD